MLSSSFRGRNQAHMNVTEVLPLDTKLKLSEGLDKRHTLDVTDGSTKLKVANYGPRLLSNLFKKQSALLSNLFKKQPAMHVANVDVVDDWCENE